MKLSVYFIFFNLTFVNTFAMQVIKTLDYNQRSSALLYACIENKRSLVELILNYDVNIDYFFDGKTPLICAIRNANKDIAKLLLQHKADSNFSAGMTGRPLHSATELGRNEFIPLLLEHGANINLDNYRGLTPIEIALKKDIPLVSLLLDYGAWINNSNGNQGPSSSFPQKLFRKNNSTLIKLLLKHGLTFDFENEEIQTIVRKIFSHVPLVIATLLREPIDEKLIEDSDISESLSYFCAYNNVTLVELCLKKMKKITHEALQDAFKSSIRTGNSRITFIFLDSLFEHNIEHIIDFDGHLKFIELKLKQALPSEELNRYALIRSYLLKAKVIQKLKQAQDFSTLYLYLLPKELRSKLYALSFEAN